MKVPKGYAAGQRLWCPWPAMEAANPGVSMVNELIDLGIVYKASDIHALAMQVISADAQTGRES